MKRSGSVPERGAAAVEFALVAMILIVLMVGAVEFGRLWMMQASLSSAARDAARELAIKKATADPQAVLDDVFPFGTPTIASQVSCPVPADPLADTSAELSASFSTTTVTGLLPIVDPVTLSAEGVMRCGG